MNWITRLFTEINELITVMAAKLNTLNTNKEDKANKQTNLSSTNANHYPNVPAVKQGLDDTLATAQVYTDTKVQQASGNYIPLTQKGANNGVAELDSGGKVPASQLPSYVDDVLEGTYISATVFHDKNGNPYTPEDGIAYIDISNTANKGSWRWSGTQYTKIENSGLTLGTTSATAHRGDHGVIAYTHSQATGNPHGTTIAQIPNLQSELNSKSDVGHVHAYATATVPGFVELGSNTVQTQTIVAVSATANRTYAVQLNSANQAVVNVPWTDNNTTYTAGTLPILNAGTSSTPQLWAADVLNPWADGKYTKAADMGDPTVGIPDWSGALQTQTPSI